MIIVISHFIELAESIKKLIQEMFPTIDVYTYSTNDRKVDITRFLKTIDMAHEDYHCFYDLGSSKFLLNYIKDKSSNKNVYIYDAPIVEGSFLCASLLTNGHSIEAIKSKISEYTIRK